MSEGPEIGRRGPAVAVAESGPRPKQKASARGLHRLWRGARRGFKSSAYPALALAAIELGSAAGVICFAGMPEDGGRAAARVFGWTLWGGLVLGITLLGPAAAVLDWSVGGSVAGLWSLATGRPPGPVPDRRGRWRRTLRRVGLAFTALCATSFLTTAALAWWVEGRWLAVRARSNVLDPTWRMDELRSRLGPIPDDENGALIVAEASAARSAEFAKLSRQGGRNDPARAAYRRLFALGPTVPLDEETAATLAEDVGRGDAATIARRLAGYERGRTDVEPANDVFETPLPHLNDAYTVAATLRADSALRAHRGDLDGAVESCRAMLGVARSIGDEPGLVAQSTRSEIGEMAVSAALRVLGRGEPSDEALEPLQEDLVAEYQHRPILPAIKGERALLMEYLRRLGEGRMTVVRHPGAGPWLRLARDLPEPWIRLWADFQATPTLWRMDEAAWLPPDPPADHLALLVRAWREPFAPYVPAWLQPSLLAVPHRRLPDLLTPAMRMHRRRSEMGALAVLVAAERHRRAHGAWPESAAEIDEAILPTQPPDPADEGYYAFKRLDDRVRVYSFGFNRDDDGGEAAPDFWQNGGPDDAAVEAVDPPLRGRASEPVESSP